MRYRVLATDYDGTLAHDGVTADTTIDALESFKGAGGRLIMVTGREVPDLERTFDRLDLFESVVAENGGLLFDPRSRVERVLAPPSDAGLAALLEARGVTPLSVGRTVLATIEPHDVAVLDAIRELGLELQIIFNKGAVMVLPSGVNKATGLAAALDALDLAADLVAGIGDAENDHAFLDLCGLSVAVSNAIPAVKERARLVTTGARGDGVRELIGRLLRDDLP